MSIIEKVQELQALIVEKYGVQAEVCIYMNSIYNSRLTRELANDISFDIAKQCKELDIYSYVNERVDDTKWVELRLPNEMFNFVAFYNTQDIEEKREAC